MTVYSLKGYRIRHANLYELGVDLILPLTISCNLTDIFGLQFKKKILCFQKGVCIVGGINNTIVLKPSWIHVRCKNLLQNTEDHVLRVAVVRLQSNLIYTHHYLETCNYLALTVVA